MNTESPTPSSGSESVPTTPTTLSTRTRGRKLKEAEPPSATTTATAAHTDKPTEEDEETVKSTHDDDEQMDEKELVAEARKDASKETVSSVRKRRIAALKDDAMPSEKGGDKSEPSTPTTDKTDKTAGASTLATIENSDSMGMAKRPRRSVVENCMANKQPVKLANRRNSTGSKIEPSGQRLSSRIRMKQKRNAIMLKKKKPLLVKKPAAATTVSKSLRAALISEKPAAAAAAAAAVATTAAAAAAARRMSKMEKNAESASDSELLKIDRRRSDSVSKCSDATDTSSFQETKDSDDIGSTPETQTVDVKEEIAVKDEEEKTTPIKDPKKEESTANESTPASGDPENAQDVKTDSAEDKRPARRLRRNMWLPPPKTMSTRSRSETPSKESAARSEGDAVDEKDVTVKVEVAEGLETPLHIETSSDKDAGEAAPVTGGSGADDTPTDHKSDSLSPVLVSEGVSEISVKQFYGQPDFLENNLGIEEDPKLGEIVQVKEKIKNDDSDKSAKVIDNNNAEKDANDKKKKEEAKIVCEIEKDEKTIAVENDNKDAIKYMIDGDEGARNDSVEQIDDTVDKKKMSNENVIVLSGEVEVRPKDTKKAVNTKSDDENVGEVVLFAITNGVRAKPEKLVTVLENQKRKNSLDEELSPAADGEKAAAEKDDNDMHEDETEVNDGSANAAENGANSANESKDSVETVEEIAANDAAQAADQDAPVDSNDDAMDVGEAQDQPAGKTTDETSENDENSNGSDVNKENINTSSENEDLKADAQVKQSPRTADSLRVTKQKESHLKTLGLLTHQEAVAVTIEKEKRREQRKSSAASSSSSTTSNGKGKKNSEYTGTLKTVIKLHRNTGSDKKKGRMPLKMTLHKGRAKNSNGDRDGSSAGNSEEDTYYTIHSEVR